MQPTAWMIEFVELHKAFNGAPVLEDVNLKVATGTTCALMGVSGCGKTILLKHLMGLVKPDRGRVSIDGEDLSTLSPRRLQILHEHLGVLFQAGALFDSMTVFENVAFPLREQLHLGAAEVRGRVEQTLKLLGLQGTEALLPSLLSGGMRKRVAFARAIVTHPQLLIYNEPTAGLDPLRTQAVISEILLAKHELNVTQLVVTSDLPTAFAIADDIALMDSGTIVAKMPASEFKSCRHPVARAFLRHWNEREEGSLSAGAHGL